MAAPTGALLLFPTERGTLPPHPPSVCTGHLPLQGKAIKNPRFSVEENRGREVQRRPLIFSMGEGRKMCRNCRRSSSFTLL